ncbi:MAG: biotin/lipoyl-containing protein [Nonlabens sp.]|uniref:biotin/lipoyl-containing protein n=1 Tax=Nonlabens sp. TaxID=1888209 RepID=UPI003EFB0CA3
MNNYTIHVDHQDFKVTTTDLQSVDIHKVNPEELHVLKKNKAFKVSVISQNLLDKTMTVSVNGNNYQVKIDDEYDTMVAQMGLLEKTEATSNNINAPMPGYIVDIMVKAGDHIENETPLFVLSAMKMENVILSNGKGIIKSIEAKIDDSVVKGQLIIEMES